MPRTILAAVLIILLGGLTVLAAKFLWPYATQKYEAYQQAVTSDSRVSLTIRIGGDGYLGYWFITAPDTRREAARRGIAISFQDDGGSYAARLQKFANREYDAIVLPISSYIQHGAAHKFPGVIVAAIAAAARKAVTLDERDAVKSHRFAVVGTEAFLASREPGKPF